MGLLRDVVGLEGRALKDKTRIPGPGEEHRAAAGVSVTETSALGHIDVYKNVSLIADAIAMLPVHGYQNRAVRQEDGTIVTHGHKMPVQPLAFTDPMPGDLTSAFSFKHRVMSSLLLDGNTYNEVAAIDAQGYPSAIMPIHPTKVRDATVNRAGLVEFHMHDGGIMGSYRDGGTMVHWPGFIQPGKILGLSPIKAGMQGIALSIAAERFGAKWFRDGAHPSGFLKDSRDREDIDEDEARDTKRKWVATYTGLSREPAYLYGDLSWEQIQVSAEESQFIETRAMQGAQLAALYRNPPHLVGDVTRSTSWGSGLEEQGIGFVVYTLGPWLTRFEQALTMLRPRGQYAKFNVGALLRGKQAERYAGYAIGRQWGWLSTNDIRGLEDMPPVEGGDIYLQPLNMIEASEALALLMAGKDNDTEALPS